MMLRSDKCLKPTQQVASSQVGSWVKTSDSKFYMIVLLYVYNFRRAVSIEMVLPIIACSGSLGCYKIYMFDLEKLKLYLLLEG